MAGSPHKDKVAQFPFALQQTNPHILPSLSNKGSNQNHVLYSPTIVSSNVTMAAMFILQQQK